MILQRYTTTASELLSLVICIPKVYPRNKLWNGAGITVLAVSALMNEQVMLKKLVSQLMSSSGNNKLSVQVNMSVNSPPVTVGNLRIAEGSDQKKIVIKDVTN